MRLDLVVYLIVRFFMGLVVGAFARLLLPGPDPMGIGLTAVVGLCGTFSAGLFSWYVPHRHGAGLVLSVVFSMLVVWIYRRSRGGATAAGLAAVRECACRRRLACERVSRLASSDTR